VLPGGGVLEEQRRGAVIELLDVDVAERRLAGAAPAAGAAVRTVGDVGSFGVDLKARRRYGRTDTPAIRLTAP
jgi:hypothetical protein